MGNEEASEPVGCVPRHTPGFLQKRKTTNPELAFYNKNNHFGLIFVNRTFYHAHDPALRHKMMDCLLKH